MVKRKQKKAIKQKQKVNVKQNVKVVIGDVKKKRAVKSSGAKSGASAKPPIVLNISNPQPYNNMYMEYFRKQLQNQQPTQANTLAQFEKINEREETKASKAGALHSLDREPDDVARELRRQESSMKTRMQSVKAERKMEAKEFASSIKKFKTPRTPRTPKQPVKLVLEETSESSILSELEQQRNRVEQAISKGEESGVEAEGEESDVPATPIPTFKPPQNPVSDKPKTVRRRGRRRLTEEEIQARLEEEARLRAERIGMIAEDKPRRGRKMLTQEEIDKRRKERELQKLQRLFEEGDTDENVYGRLNDY